MYTVLLATTGRATSWFVSSSNYLVALDEKYKYANIIILIVISYQGQQICRNTNK